MPVAIFNLACRKSSVPEQRAMLLLILGIAELNTAISTVPRLELGSMYTEIPVKPCRYRVQFTPQTRINRFVFLILLIFSFDQPLGLTASPH